MAIEVSGVDVVSADFLLELRSEEIPARMQAGARAELEKLFRREMVEAGVSVGEVTVWSTPRRLALIARGLPISTAAVSEEAKGPPEGAPDAAIDGFCRKSGVTREQLELRDVKGRNTWFAVIEKPGRATIDLLTDAIPAIIRDFAWPKSQRWGAASLSTESLRWVRPLSGIVAIFGEELVECEVDGIASTYATHGHRFHCPGEITIGSASDYAEKLRACHVIVDHEERQDLIRASAAKVVAEAGLKLVEDEGLVIENAGLTEWPVPLLGRFDESYLDVPPEVIQLTARVNQKYFVCESPLPPAVGDGGGPEHGETPTPNPSRKREGNLANAFVCTANIAAVDPAVVVDGNRKVLAARLSDARFFWELDQKTTLADHGKKLERITFHEKLGTVADKVNRVAKLARWLCEEKIVAADPDLAEQAARLCKADLVTEMVGEFPELQGLMGGYYAEQEDLPKEVSDAIRDHYKPVGQGDEVPTAPVTVAVSLADKLDTAIGMFAVDELPTGSKDPFALRRAFLAANSLIDENRLRFSIGVVVDSILQMLFDRFTVATSPFQVTKRWESFQSIDKLEEADDGLDIYFYEMPISQPEFVFPNSEREAEGRADFYLAAPRKTRARCLQFLADRLKVQQREAGVRHDLIDAVFALGGEDDLVRLLARVKALQNFMNTEDGANLLAGYKRAANILKKESYESPLPRAGGEGGGPKDGAIPTPNPSRKRERNLELSYTPEAAEKALIDALDAAEPKAAAAIEGEDFEGAMAALASLRSPIDRFFDEVTVNADEENKRAYRLDLLARFRAAVHNVADFSRIEG